MNTTVINRSIPGQFFDWAVEQSGGDEFKLVVYGSIIAGLLAYFVSNFFFVLADFVDPVWIQPYRIQDGENKKVTFDKWIRAFKLISFNVFVVGTAMEYLYYLIGRYDISDEMPSIATVLLHMTVFSIVEEIGFYYSHRLFHHPRIYKYVHKIHHEWTAPVSITSVYAHPIEHTFSNILPLLIGPVLMRSHILLAWTWWSVAIFTTTVSHSGYHLPFLPSAEAHDYHHLAFNECFGVLGFLDYFHGTNKTFRSSVRYDRHHTTYTLEPVKKTFPEREEAKTK